VYATTVSTVQHESGKTFDTDYGRGQVNYQRDNAARCWQEAPVLFGSPRSETAPAFSASPDGDSSWQLSIASFPQTETQP